MCAFHFYLFYMFDLWLPEDRPRRYMFALFRVEELLWNALNRVSCLKNEAGVDEQLVDANVQDLL